ncbi:unnamed protein product, partial [Cylicostephanus goldi]
PTAVVDKDVIREIFAQISNRSSKQSNFLFNVFDAFSIPRFEFDADCRKILPVSRSSKVVSDVDKATQALRHRFQLVAQRIGRCRQLQSIKFSTIEALLSSSHRQSDVVVVGMLTQQKACSYHLRFNHCFHIEDLTGSVQVKFDENTKFQLGIFTEGCVAIFQGSYEASLLDVREVASIPIESAVDTRSTFGNVNWFGGDDAVAFRCNVKLCVAERSNPNAQIILISDVHLDDFNVMKALYHMLSGFSNDPPLAFIFCGNFCSKPRQRDTMDILHKGFQ